MPLSWCQQLTRYILAGVEKSAGTQPGPANKLYLGLVVTILAVLVYAAYITIQFAGVRRLQSEMVDRNRKDSLQLLRIQNDLNSLGLAMQDMLDGGPAYPLVAFSAQFGRMRTDREDALHKEEALTVVAPTNEQRRYMFQLVEQFWTASDQMFALAQSDENAAREQIRDKLEPQRELLTSAIARLLVQNNEAEEQAATRIAGIYDRVQRQLYFFLAAVLLAIVVTRRD